MERKSPAPDHRYNTRQVARLAESTAKTLQVHHPPLRGEFLAAHSPKAQTKFLEGVGIITTKVEPLEEVLDADEAELLSCALRHNRIPDPRLTCPYFTDEQWEALVNDKSALLDDAEEMVELVAKGEQLFTAHVAQATIDRREGEDNFVGDVTYKMVHSVNPFDLRQMEDLSLFASVFIATIKTTLQ